MRILDKYLYKELFFTLIAVLLVFLLVVFGTEITRVLAEVIDGKLPGSLVFQVFMLRLPSALGHIVPLTVLIGVLLVFGRLYQDQEMVVLNSCGVGASYFQKILFIFLVPWFIALAVISLWLTPWAGTQEKVLLSEAQAQAPIAGLTAGRFNSLPQTNGVLYAAEIKEDGSLSEVWLRTFQNQQDVIVVAPHGKFEWVDKRLALVLRDGFSYQGLTQGEDLVVRQYERFDAFLPEIAKGSVSQGLKDRSSLELWQSSDLRYQATLQMRLAQPFILLGLGLLALRLSKTAPRQGRFGRLAWGLVIYVAVFQFSWLIYDWIKAGIWPVYLGMWPLVIALFAGAFMKMPRLTKSAKGATA